MHEPLGARLQRRPDQARVRRARPRAPHGPPATCGVAPHRPWGLVPFWAKDPKIGNRMINARMETVAEKPAFKQAFAKRRCLLPADGYFEWYPTEQKGKSGKPLKQPFYIHPADGSVMAMAGLYEIWRDPTREEDDPARFRGPARCSPPRPRTPSARSTTGCRCWWSADRYADWLDPGDGPGRAAGLLVPGRARAARGAPGLHRGQQRPQQLPGAPRTARQRLEEEQP